jgi:hypothetical protein
MKSRPVPALFIFFTARYLVQQNSSQGSGLKVYYTIIENVKLKTYIFGEMYALYIGILREVRLYQVQKNILLEKEFLGEVYVS